MSGETARRVLALLDDAASARSVIEWSSAVARQWERPLELVYVESASALRAAALPFTRVLMPGAAQWRPFDVQDVERGYRAQRERLSALAERITVRESVTWSLRVLRGDLPELAIELRAQSDLLLVGAGGTAPAAPQREARRERAGPVVMAVIDDSPDGERALQVAGRLAKALSGRLMTRQVTGTERGRLPAGLVGPGPATGADRCDLVVMPRSLMPREALAALARPTLLVG